MSPLRSLSPRGWHFLTLGDERIQLMSFDGGTIRGEVETVDTGPQQVSTKHISRLRYEAFTITIGLSMGQALGGWIKSSLALNPERKHGSIVATSVEGKAQSYCHFSDTLIEEITVPAMDASSKEAAYFTIRFQPEELSYEKGDDAVVTSRADVRKPLWLAGNFRLGIGDLPCQRVTKIDAFTIRQRIVESSVGQLRSASTKEPVNIQVPNLKVTLSAADAGAWQDWFSEFVIRGHNDQGSELHGTLEFLDPSMKEVLGSIEFSQLGIISLAPATAETRGESLPQYVAELYVESMAINLATT
jgi:hypothetical protein